MAKNELKVSYADSLLEKMKRVSYTRQRHKNSGLLLARIELRSLLWISVCVPYRLLACASTKLKRLIKTKLKQIFNLSLIKIKKINIP